jgi:hypothetical protein
MRSSGILALCHSKTETINVYGDGEDRADLWIDPVKYIPGSMMPPLWLLLLELLLLVHSPLAHDLCHQPLLKLFR